jgi:hypothetical protein
VGIETNILKGLLTQIDNAGIAPVAWPNIAYDGVRPYLDVSLLPAPTRGRGISAGNTHSGFLQINVVVDAGTSAVTVTGLVDDVISLFPRVSQIIEGDTTINIDDRGWPGPAGQTPSGYFIPVTIPYTVL